ATFMFQHLPIIGRRVGLAAVLAVCGCAVDPEADGYVKVSGQVTYHGQPVKRGTINFLPQRAQGVVASGEIENGTIKNVTTHTLGDGVLEGEYTVTVIAFEETESKPRPDRYNGPNREEVAALVSNAKALIPFRYGSVAG